MTTARRTLAAVVVVTLMALGGAGAALAAPQAPQALSPQCERLTNGITLLQSTRSNVATLVAQLQVRIASRTLRPAQLRLARVFLAGLEWQLARIEAALSRLEERFATLCSDGGGGEEELPPPAPGGE